MPEAERSSIELKKCSCDDKTKSSGRTLLKLCNKHNLRIANGQTPGDRLGNYTCYNFQRANVVGHLLVEETIS